MKKKGRLFVVSAPSGAGKTTLIKEVSRRFSHLFYSVSHTTRQPRTGETHGIDYFFITDREFSDMLDQNLWLEWAEVHGNYYGTSKAFVEDNLKKGNCLLLDIDVQGGKQIMDSGLDFVSVFIMPPSMDVLRQRLEKRGTDSPEVIARRLENARTEVLQKDLYDHVVVNDNLDETIKALCLIFEKEMESSQCQVKQ